MAKTGIARDKANSRPVVYIGPNIPAKGLKSYRIYKNGIPKEFQGIFRSLFVLPEELNLARKEATTKGTAVNMAYKKITNTEWSEE